MVHASMLRIDYIIYRRLCEMVKVRNVNILLAIWLTH
jgi:hypothetical protein